MILCAYFYGKFEPATAQTITICILILIYPIVNFLILPTCIAVPSVRISSMSDIEGRMHLDASVMLGLMASSYASWTATQWLPFLQTEITIYCAALSRESTTLENDSVDDFKLRCIGYTLRELKLQISLNTTQRLNVGPSVSLGVYDLERLATTIADNGGPKMFYDDRD